MMMDMNIPRNSSEIDQFIDKVFYCGINSVISIIGILGNVLLLIIFIHPSLIPHKTLFHSYLKVIALADLLYLLYVTVYNSCVCMGFTDYPVEVGSKSLATFLGFMMAHQQVLSVPSDLLVCLMTFMRLKIIMKVGEKMTGLGSSNTPRPVIHEVLAVYFLSIMLDSPNWVIFETKPCEGHNELGYENCWSYAEKSSICDNPMWMIVVILQCVLAKIIPGISILVMNIIIIVKLNKIWKKKQKLSEQFRSREPSLTVQPGSSDPSPSSSPTPPRHPHNGGSPRRPGMAFLEIPGASASSSLGSTNSPRRGSKIMKGIYSSIREFRLSLLLVSTLVFYTLLTTPKTFFNVIASFDLMEDWEKKGKQTFRFAYAISNVLFNINYSCNFYVYCLANSEIKTAFKKLIRMCSSWVMDTMQAVKK